MTGIIRMSSLRLVALLCGIFFTAGHAVAQSWVTHSTSNNTTVVKRHETGSVVSGNKLYVIGGRGNKPVQVFDAAQNKWSTLAPLPLELHHFQPVELNGYIYAIGAFTCCYPTEPTIADIYRLNLSTNTWQTHGTMPNSRLRGSAGAVVRNNKIYLIGGNTNGHSGGAVGWFDEYDPATGNWTTLPDAPNARDHFSAAVVGNKLVATSGRQTSAGFGGMVAATDVYDFNTNNWNTVAPIPTPRAGTMLGVRDGKIIIMGGETDTQIPAHDEVEAYDVAANEWTSLASLGQGRHGGAGGVIGDTLHAITGNLNRGGGQEVTLHETLIFADDSSGGNNNNNTLDSDNDGLTDQREAALQTDPQNNDSDGDSLTDGDEVNQHNTNPLSHDSDSDGLPDNEEVSLGTNPLNADSDADGLSDIDELQTHNTNPVNNDSDNDSLSDSEELNEYFTDPLLRDSDNDGLTDDEEILTYNSNPNAWDSDGDGISDATEAVNGTSVSNTDEDGDGILNSAEGGGDSDGDSIPDFRDLDSDNDGIADIIENGRSDNNNDGKLDNATTDQATDALFDADQDGIINSQDLDSDQDGLTDLLEAGHGYNSATGMVDTDFTDNNQNGWHDALEGSAPADTDADATPDFLDLDSNDDGTTDLATSGIVDSDDNGMIDSFIDANADGLHDDIAGLERITSTGDQNPDDSGSSDNTNDTSSTVTQTKTGGGSDPLLPFILSIIAVVAMRRR